MSTSFSNTGNLGLNSDYTPIASGGGGGAVTSVFGRTGVVVALAGDYSASLITNDSSVTGAFVADALNTLDTTKASLNSAVTFGGIAGQRFEVFNDGSTQINHGTLTIGKAVGSTFTALNMYNQNSTSLQIVTTTDAAATNYLLNINTQGATTTDGTILVRNNVNEFKFRNISDYAVSKTLTSGNIIVGNGSNVATAVAMSGDATISNTGALTISNQAVTFAKMQHISSQHLVGRHAAGTGDIQQISLGTGLSFSGSNLQVTGFIPTTLTSANIIVGNGSNVATAVAMSGDATISNTGAVTLANSGVTPATYGSATQVPVFAVDSKGRVTSVTDTAITGFVPTTLTSGNIIVGNASNVATAVAMSGDATISNTGAVTLANSGVTPATYGSATQVPVFAVDSKGRVTSVTDTAITGFVPTSLTSANIIVGNASNVATAVAMSGDIGISNTGATTIQNDAVTTTKILNSNVTYAKIQDVTTNNRLLGRATAGAGVIEELTLGTNLSFTGTTLNAAGGGYVYSAITLSGDVTYNKSNFAGANYINLSTNDTSTRTLTIGTGYSANDFLVLNFNQLSPGAITLIIGGDTFSFNVGNSILAVYDGTNWNLNSLANAFNTSGATNRSLALGLGSGRVGSDNTIIGLGNSYSNGSSSVYIGSNNTSSNVSNSVLVGSGSSVGANGVAIGVGITSTIDNAVAIGQDITANGINVVAIGKGVNTSTNIDVVAIGQGITTTNTNAVIIGKSASGGGSSTVVIGRGAVANGSNSISIGQGTTAGTNTGVVAIGQGITTTNTDAVIIGRGASASGTASITVGALSTSTGVLSNNLIYGVSSTTSSSSNILIGNSLTTTDANNILIGHSISLTAASPNTAVLIGNSVQGIGGNVVIGHTAQATGAASVTVGTSSTGSGSNSVRVGVGITTGTNTGVVAIGQGITTTNIDAVVIGRAASAGGAANVTIGGSATGTGANCVRIGNAVSTSNNSGIVAIGQGAQTTGVVSNVIVIGTGTTTAATNSSIAIGSSLTVGVGHRIVIGQNLTNLTNVGSAILIGDNLTFSSASVTANTNVILANSSNFGNHSTGYTFTQNTVIGTSISTAPTTASTSRSTQNVMIGRNINLGTGSQTNSQSQANTLIGESIFLSTPITSSERIMQRNIIIGNNSSISAFGSGSTIQTTIQNNIILGQNNTQTANSAVTTENNTILGQNNTFSQLKNGIVIGSGNTVTMSTSNDITNNIVIGSDNTIAYGSILNETFNVAIGFGINANIKPRQFAKGAYAYPRHYGAESRRIDTNTSATDATAPSRHDEKDAWNGTTTNNATTELFLFGVSNERLTLQDNEILTATVQVQAKRNATTDCFVDTAFVSIVRGVGAGTVTLVLAPSSINTGFLGTGSTVTYTLDADTTNGSLRFRATGNTGETWQWTANIITYTRTRTA